MASSVRDLQCSLDRFAAECEAAGMKISTFNSEVMVLSRKRVDGPIRVGSGLLPRMKEFKYLGVLFTSQEIVRRISTAGAVLRPLYCTIVTKRELSKKAKLSRIYTHFCGLWYLFNSMDTA